MINCEISMMIINTIVRITITYTTTITTKNTGTKRSNQALKQGEITTIKITQQKRRATHRRKPTGKNTSNITTTICTTKTKKKLVNWPNSASSMKSSQSRSTLIITIIITIH